MRGLAVTNCQFIREAQNSLARCVFALHIQGKPTKQASVLLIHEDLIMLPLPVLFVQKRRKLKKAPQQRNARQRESRQLRSGKRSRSQKTGLTHITLSLTFLLTGKFGSSMDWGYLAQWKWGRSRLLRLAAHHRIEKVGWTSFARL